MSNIDPLLRELNPPQRQAVIHGEGPLLVLAGAGSGKTRVLTHRIAWLVERADVDPRRILAVTFTNKAAREMAERVHDLLGYGTGAWIGTFHATALRILRSHGDLLKVGRGFAVYDADDQLRLAKRVVKGLGIDKRRYKPSALLGAVQRAKDDGLGPEEFIAEDGQHANPYERVLGGFYKCYQRELVEAGAMDFGDLLLQTLTLFSRHPEVADNYAERFTHVLIDEYQDTNRVQHLIAKRISARWRNLFVVGDDDQSIYAWRGAEIKNILNFADEQPGAEVIKLEQNYRSTAPILQAASSVIDHNSDRHGKTLWTECEEGVPVELYAAPTEEEEAAWTVARIRELTASGTSLAEIGILYRTHALSRPLEVAFMSEALPYVIYGGLRFYERREVKDVVAFLRLALNPNDRIAFTRTVNLPPRGIGAKTVERIMSAADLALGEGRPGGLWGTTRELVEEGGLGPRAARAVAGFVNMVEGWREALEKTPLPQLLERILIDTGYREYLDVEKDERATDRLENIEELLSDAESFLQEAGKRRDAEEEDAPNTDTPAALASAFLDRASLVSEQDRSGQKPDAVTLMTIHSAKGLEYPCVFVTGLEEGVFPHSRSLEEPGAVEEERRLCYVAITRARERLYLTRSRMRRVYGDDSLYRASSRFLQELPEELRPPEPLYGDPGSRTLGLGSAQGGLARSTSSFGQSSFQESPSDPFPDYEADQNSVTESEEGGSYYLPEPGEAEYKNGMTVRHQRYGTGKVATVEGSGGHARVVVDFAKVGRKKFIAGMANLEIRLDG